MATEPITATKSFVDVWNDKSVITITPAIVDKDTDEVTSMGQSIEISLKDLVDYIGSEIS